ncbi:MAG: DNA-directed RNA polymerase [DPANN group archaeon]|nr:DNA-directed RNA polymerase [DPANN group archaeon]
MYYRSQIDGVARIEPKLFGEELKQAISLQLKADYEGKPNPELGMVIAIVAVDEIGEGVIIPGDGAAYYRSKFTAIHYLPEINELVEGDIKDIAKFGAFVDFGPFEGMVHVSQAMDDFVSFSKSGALQGKQSNRILKVGDKVRARVIAVSFRDPKGPKIGLTMRQPYLGKQEWIDDLVKGEAKAAKKAEKEEKAEKTEKKKEKK